MGFLLAYVNKKYSFGVFFNQKQLESAKCTRLLLFNDF